MRVLRSAAPSGFTAASTGARNLPSNIVRPAARLRRSPPLLRVRFYEMLHDTAVDRVDEHQATLLRRIFGRVAQHAPCRPAPQAVPHLLRRRVPDRKGD